MRPVVGRSKMCLDHAATLYGVYLLTCLMASGPSSVCHIYTLGFMFICGVVTTQIGRFYCMRSELEPIQVGSSLNNLVLNQSVPNPTFTRLRALLPIVSGTVAKLLNYFKEKPATESEAVPLRHLPPSQSVSATPKKVVL